MQYRTCCIYSTAELINALQESARPISRRTFLRYVDRAELRTIETNLGYEATSRHGGLSMARDWHVAYYRGVYDGRPCVYFDHSRIEYIFQ
jgi:hypothetical protein